jgi:hypothetical protein
MISITSTASGFNVNFNGYFESGKVDVKTGYWSKQSISRILNRGTYIEVVAVGESWLLNTTGIDDLLGVSSVDEVNTSTIDELHEKLVDLL